MTGALIIVETVATWYQMGQDVEYPEPNFSSWTKNSTGNIYFGSNEPPVGIVNQHINVMDDHPRLARKIAAEAIALLKNERGTLPLKKPLRIGVYGEDSALDPAGPNVCPDRGCNNGTLAVGWGSGATDFEVSQPLHVPIEITRANFSKSTSLIPSQQSQRRPPPTKASLLRLSRTTNSQK